MYISFFCFFFKKILKNQAKKFSLKNQNESAEMVNYAKTTQTLEKVFQNSTPKIFSVGVEVIRKKMKIIHFFFLMYTVHKDSRENPYVQCT